METEFKSSKGALVRNFIGTIFMSGTITMLFTMFFLVIFDNFNFEETMTFVLIVGIPIVTIMSGYLAFYKRNIKVIITNQTISFYRGKKEYLSFYIKDYYFSSYVLRHYINGIHSGTDRYLVVIDNMDNKKQYRCFNFSKNTFNSFIALVTSFNIKESDPLIESIYNNDYQMTNKVFKLPKDNILSSFKKRGLIILGVLFALAIICIVWYISLINRLDSEFNASLAIALFTMLALIIVPFVISIGFQYHNFSKHMPAQITVSNNSIIIDDTTFDFSQVIQIKATPPTYSNLYYSNQRTFIITITGSKKTYLMGQISHSKKPKDIDFKDYQELCETLRNILGPDKFQYNL